MSKESIFAFDPPTSLSNPKNAFLISSFVMSNIFGFFILAAHHEYPFARHMRKLYNSLTETKTLLINTGQYMPVGISFPLNTFQPLVIGYLASVLIKNNYIVEILDVLVEGWVRPLLFKSISKLHAHPYIKIIATKKFSVD